MEERREPMVEVAAEEEAEVVVAADEMEDDDARLGYLLQSHPRDERDETICHQEVSRHAEKCGDRTRDELVDGCDYVGYAVDLNRSMAGMKKRRQV